MFEDEWEELYERDRMNENYAWIDEPEDEVFVQLAHERNGTVESEDSDE